MDDLKEGMGEKDKEGIMVTFLFLFFFLFLYGLITHLIFRVIQGEFQEQSAVIIPFYHCSLGLRFYKELSWLGHNLRIYTWK